MIGFEFAFEEGALVSKFDARFAGMNLRLPMEDFWPWPDVFREGKASLIEDIREVPAFALRDRLLPLGIVTVLLIPMSIPLGLAQFLDQSKDSQRSTSHANPNIRPG